MISAGQIKAARAMLDWSQEALAEASGLSHKTIYNLERGFLSPSSSKEVKKALELKGFEFYEDTGLIRRANELKIYRGVNASNLFFEDLYSAVKDKGGEIAVICKSQEILAQSLGIENMHDLERFKKIGNYANLKCILSETGNELLSLPSAQFKVLPKYHTFMPFYFIYGGKYAIAIRENTAGFLYVVINSVSQALAGWDEFTPLWNNASSLVVANNTNKRP